LAKVGEDVLKNALPFEDRQLVDEATISSSPGDLHPRIAARVEARFAYRAPAEDLAGVTTLVRVDEGVSDQDRTPESALPSGEAEGKEIQIPKYEYNTPPPEGGLPTVRTLGIPGEEYGVPYKDTPLLTRRTMKGQTMKGMAERVAQKFLDGGGRKAAGFPSSDAKELAKELVRIAKELDKEARFSPFIPPRQLAHYIKMIESQLEMAKFYL
jgi:hypothetical protein